MTNKTCPDTHCPQYGLVYFTMNFCTTCGKELVEMPKCPKCGAEVYPNNNFCPQCGRPIK